MSNKEEPQVEFFLSREERKVILTIDCPSDLLVGKYLAILEAWLDDAAALRPSEVKNIRSKSK